MTHARARFTAAGVPGAELEVLASGGHLMLGRGAQAPTRVHEFLAQAGVERRADRRMAVVNSYNPGCSAQAGASKPERRDRAKFRKDAC